MDCFRPGRPRMSERKEEIMENKRRVMNDALGGLGGVNSISGVRLDLIIYTPLIVRRETKMECRYC